MPEIISRRRMLAAAGALAATSMSGCTTILRWLGLRPDLGPRFVQAFDSNFYNGLGEVEDAFAQLSAHPDHERLIGEGLNIIQSSGGGRDTGLYLLHRHFSVVPASIMLERPVRRSDGEWLYVSGSVNVGTVGHESVAPSRFIVVAGREPQIIPLEFSSDRRVVDGFNRVARNDRLLRELSSYLEESAVGELLGVAMLGRSYQTKGTIGHERNFVSPPLSVIQYYHDLQFDPAEATPTLWSGSLGDCTGCCRIETHCDVWCAPPVGGGGHEKWEMCQDRHVPFACA